VGGGIALQRADETERGIARDEDALRELMRRYQGGDPVAVEDLVRRLSPSLLSFLSGPLVSRSDADDLLQECWLRIHRSRHAYNATEPLLPWIFSIARHTRLDGYRRRRRHLLREVLVEKLPERAPTPECVWGSHVMKLLDRLPEAQREVVVMLKVSGMTLEDVAHATASSVGSVKQKAHRAYARLRQLLELEGEK
jgi:RNA polymerase sigma-70 factor (ECF subfamily)